MSEEVKELQSLRREKIVAKTFALPNENPKVTLPLNIQINHSKINSIDNSLKEGPKAKSHMHGAQTSSNDQQQPFVPSKRLVPSPSGTPEPFQFPQAKLHLQVLSSLLSFTH